MCNIENLGRPGEVAIHHCMHIHVHACTCRYEVRGCEIVWAIKDSSITRTFFDEGAATFFLPHLAGQPAEKQAASSDGGDDVVEVSPLKRTKYTVESRSRTGNGNGGDAKGVGTGGALGPDWHSELKMTGKAFNEVSKLYNGCNFPN